MANNDMIQAKQVVDDLTASFEKHATQISTAWNNLKNYSDGIVALPSDVKAMMTAINNDTNAIKTQNEVLKQSIILAKKQQAEAVKLASIQKTVEQGKREIISTSIKENQLKKSKYRKKSIARKNSRNKEEDFYNCIFK
jgi:hypothetical protein